MPRKLDAIKQLALEYLLENVGHPITRAQIEGYVRLKRQDAPDDTAGEVTRRIRDLRQEGWKIETRNYRSRLKPNEYVLVSAEQGTGFERRVSQKQRARILEYYGFTCAKCGLGANDPDPYNAGQKIKLKVDHVIPLDDGGSNDDSNLQVLCEPCNAGKKAFYNPSRATRNLLAEVRARPEREQKEVYEFLRRKFEPD